MSWLIAKSPHSIRFFGNALRFFAGEGAKRTVIATPAAILGTTALAPALAAAATVATVTLTAYSLFCVIQALVHD